MPFTRSTHRKKKRVVVRLATNQVQNVRDAHAAGDGAKEQREYDKYVENMTAGGHKPKSLKELRGN